MVAPVEPRSDGQVAGEAYDVLIVGSGFAGLYALHSVRQLGMTVRVLETGHDVGGTWFWNRYPGARCDVPSIEYSYSFSDEIQQEWTWTETYPAQAEVLRYINFVTDRLDLRRDIDLHTTVTQAVYDEQREVWNVRTEGGRLIEATYLIMATGSLSVPKEPEIPGLRRFRGSMLHTARWPDGGFDFSGKRVGVFGTGSTGIQVIPEIAKQAAEVHVFQRTPNFSFPARNTPLAHEYVAEVKANYRELRETAKGRPSGSLRPVGEVSALSVSEDERERTYAEAWAAGGPALFGSYSDLMTDFEANETAADFVRRQIRSVVQDPVVAEALCPYDHPLGAKRPCADTNYFETYNLPHVHLVDLRKTQVIEVTEHGVRTRDGLTPLDVIVNATGFDAMTGALLKIDIHGRGGTSLQDQWEAGPLTYLGLAVSGFPNMFVIAGPGSPSVLSNMVASIEQHVEWVAEGLAWLRANGRRTLEASAEAQAHWVTHVNDVADATLYTRANSWYLGANVPGKPRVFMPYVGGVPAYRERCEKVAANGYEDFLVS
jgi:cation diffusion facilitator CzcD-associated flavoprotein CzcO